MQQHPSWTPSEGRPCVGLGRSIEELLDVLWCWSSMILAYIFLRMNPFGVGALCSLRNLALKMFQNILLAFHPLYYYVVFGIMHVWWYTTWRQRKTIHLRTGACKTCRPTGDVFNKELVVWPADGRMMQTVVGFSLSVVERKAKWQPSFSKYSHGDIDRWCRVQDWTHLSWNGVSWIFDAINSALTIVVH